MDKVSIFVERLKKININIILHGNYPWIYLDSVNGNKIKEYLIDVKQPEGLVVDYKNKKIFIVSDKIKENFKGNHGFTIAFLPIRKDQELNFTDIGEIFKIIRKYK